MQTICLSTTKLGSIPQNFGNCGTCKNADGKSGLLSSWREMAPITLLIQMAHPDASAFGLNMRMPARSCHGDTLRNENISVRTCTSGCIYSLHDILETWTVLWRYAVLGMPRRCHDQDDLLRLS